VQRGLGWLAGLRDPGGQRPSIEPAARVAVLRAAFSSLMTDTAFAMAVEDTLGARLNPSVGEEMTEFVDRALNTPHETVSEVKAILGLDG